MRPAALLLLLLSPLVATGCGSFQAYPGPRRPAAEVATLATGRGPAQVLLLQLNGREVGPLREGAELLPGLQQVTAALLFRDGGGLRSERRSIEFEAQAGQCYTLYADWYMYGPRLLVLDSAGARIAEWLTPKPPLHPVGADR